MTHVADVASGTGWVGLMQLRVLGMAVASRTLRDVEALGEDVVHQRRLSVAKAPSETLLEGIVGMVKPEELLVVVQEQVHRMHRARQLTVADELGISLVAIDDKASATDKARLHPQAQDQSAAGKPRFVLRALRAVHVGSAVKPVIGQLIVPAVAGETDTLPTFVDQLEAADGQTDLLECCSPDAGFFSRANLEDLGGRDRGFIAGLKGNQPTLLAAAIAALGEGVTEAAGGWDRVVAERRNGSTVSLHFARTHDEVLLWDWPCIRQVWRLRQRVETAGIVTVEDRYFVNNLPWGRMRPKAAIATIRAHWGIEDDANWTFDAIWEEDSRAWVRQDLALETLALFRILADNMVRPWRHRTLRTSAKNPLPYRRLLHLIHMALVTPLRRQAEGFG